jgi:hypothetical protein
MKVYTLPVIDDGVILVQQRELEYREVDNLAQLQIGEACDVAICAAKHLIFYGPGGEAYRKTAVIYRKPWALRDYTMQVWERFE